MSSFNLINLEQGTDDWHLWRKTGIGASDASSVLHINPWQSRKQLLRKKLGNDSEFHRNPENISPAMARGTALEAEARILYNQQKNISTEPSCIQSISHPWMIASLDGLSLSSRTCVEIKCGVKNYRSVARTLKPADYYYAQIQHVLAICEFDSIDFYSFSPGQSSILLRIERDDPYIRNLIAAEAIFWDQVIAARTSETLS